MTALLDFETFEQLYNIKEIYENRELKSSPREGEIYTTTTQDGKTYLLKRRRLCSYFLKKYIRFDCMLHEYLVGIDLNSINLPHFIKTYTYFQCPCDFYNEASSFLLLEFFDGIIINDMLNQVSYEEKVILFHQMILTLGEIQTYIRFTHYDLHFGNILVKRNNYQTKYYYCYGDYYTLETPFEIKIIDYGYSFMEGLYDDWVEVHYRKLSQGVSPNVYDDYFDYNKFIQLFLDKYDIDFEELNNIEFAEETRVELPTEIASLLPYDFRDIRLRNFVYYSSSTQLEEEDFKSYLNILNQEFKQNLENITKYDYDTLTSNLDQILPKLTSYQLTDIQHNLLIFYKKIGEFMKDYKETYQLPYRNVDGFEMFNIALDLIDKLNFIMTVMSGDVNKVKEYLPYIQPSVDDNQAILKAIEYRNFDIINLLLEYPEVDPSANDNEGIFQASEDYDLEMVQFLLKNEKVQNSLSRKDLIDITQHLNLVDPDIDVNVLNRSKLINLILNS